MPYVPTTWVDGTTKLGATNLNKLENGARDAYTQAHGVLNAQDVAYGAKGDGTTDDTAALQAFLNDLATLSSGDIGHKAVHAVIPPGVYKITSQLTLNFTGNDTASKLLSGYGARIQPTIASGDCFLVESTTGSVRNLTIEGLTIDGTNASDTAAALLHITASGSPASLYRTIVRDVVLEHFQGHGCLFDGYTFESQLFGCRFEASSGNQVGSCLKIDGSTGAGSGGSMDLYGGTYSFGLHNVFCTNAGTIKIFGGTFLQAYNEGIYIGGGIESALFAPHVENAWEGGIAANGWLSTQAGIWMTSGGVVVNASGVQSNSKMREVMRLFATNPITVIGGSSATVPFIIRAEGSGIINAIGVGTGTTATVTDGMAAGGRIVRVGNIPDSVPQGNVTKGLIQTERGNIVDAFVALAYSTSITPDNYAGSWQQILVTNTTAFTINQPSNPPDTKHTQELTIEVHNSIGGAMTQTITWDSSAGGYVFAGLTWTNPASGKNRRVTFRWNGTNWIATSISTADY